MPARLRYTVLYAAALQVFGPNHSCTESLETVLKDGKQTEAGDDDPIADLSGAERSELTERYEQIMCSLPVARIAA